MLTRLATYRSNRAVLRPRAAGLFAAAGAALIVLYPWVGTEARAMILSVVGLASIAAAWYGVVRNRPEPRSPWALMCLAATVFLIAGALRSPFGWPKAHPPLALFPELLSVVGFTLMFLGLRRLLDARCDVNRNRGALIDGLLVGIAACTVSWLVIVSPTLHQAGAPGILKVLFGMYPVIDAILIFLTMRLALTDSMRSVSYRLLIVSFSCIAVGDVLLNSVQTGALTLAQDFANFPYIPAYICFGAAMLHPSMRAMGNEQRVPPKPLSPLRIGSMAGALAIPVLLAVWVRPGSFTDRMVLSIGVVTLVATVLYRVVEVINRQVVAEARMAYKATHDELTDLPNRARMIEHLNQALVRASVARHQVAALFVDLDQFKYINDTFGHATGDELLIEVGRRLRAVVRSEDLVARIGGDEFIVVMEVSNEDGLAWEDVGQRIIDVFIEPLDLSVGEVFLTPSIGVALEDAKMGERSAEDLIRDADTAMYRAKEAGRNTMRLFDATMREQATHRVELETAMRQGIERGEFTPYYQPIVDTRTGRWVGFEALMRWQHPTRGLVSPGEFIPIAEETGLIVILGEQIMREATRQLAAWNEHAGDLTMSVNLSPRQVRDPQVTDMIAAAVMDAGLLPGRLWVEITESLMLEDSTRDPVETLCAIRDVGVHLAIDDFGTGYSSLSYISKLPVDRVKIDRAFIKEIGNEAGGHETIIKATGAIADELGFEVVAEGVETEQQRAWLADHGCRYSQGFLFSHPRPAAEISAALGDRSLAVLV